MPHQRYINPHRLWVGAFVPNWLMEIPEVSPGAKLLYARLAQHAGQNGECYPGQDTLARELATAVRTVGRYVAELRRHGLIEEQRRGLSRTNLYLFPWHPWMESAKPRRRANGGEGWCEPEPRPDRTYVSDQDRTDVADQDRACPAAQDRTESSAPIMDEENPLRESEGTTAAHRRRRPERSDAADPPTNVEGLSPTQLLSVHAMVEASFREADAIEIIVRTGASFAQVTGGIQLAQKLRGNNALRGSFRGWVRRALERGDEPDPGVVVPPDPVRKARDYSIELRRRAALAEQHAAEADERAREQDLATLTSVQECELARAAWQALPDSVRRVVPPERACNSPIVRIGMHRLFKGTQVTTG
jgi:hypothetical protein